MYYFNYKYIITNTCDSVGWRQINSKAECEAAITMFVRSNNLVARHIALAVRTMSGSTGCGIYTYNDGKVGIIGVTWRGGYGCTDRNICVCART